MIRLMLAAAILVVAGCPRQTDDHARGAAAAATVPAQPGPPSNGEILPRDVTVPVTAPGDATTMIDAGVAGGRDGTLADAVRGPL